MIKSNSKQARENIKAFIIKNFNFEDNPTIEKDDFSQIAKRVLASFNNYISESDKNRNLAAVFYDYASGLPGTLSFDDIFLGCDAARDTLADILQESDAEKEKYTESDAEKFLVNLIYRELVRGAK